MTSARLPAGGLIDRTRTISFTFDGQRYEGHPGDSLASALLANGVGLVGRSFKYHRPRGVLAAGVEEPSALVGVGVGGRFEPNTRATDLFLYEGLIAQSQNRWPSLAFDVGAVLGLFSRFIPAGFYYKAFLGKPGLWKVYEHFIRHAAGLGKPPVAADPDSFDHRAAFCDVLVVGAGPAGLTAALAASATGARVILAEQDTRLGGGLLRDPAEVDGAPAADWIEGAKATLAARGVRVLTRTTAVGYWDHDLVTLSEKLTEPGQVPAPGEPAQRLWRVRAQRVVLATGAIERPLPFADNDRPGVMLAQAVRTYVARYGVTPGHRAVIAAGNDDAYRTAFALAEAGCEIAAVLDSRPPSDSPIVRAAAERFDVRFQAQAARAIGGAGGLTGVEARTEAGALTLTCDLLAVSGGFSPVAHLHMQAGGTLSWDEATGAFTPDQARQNQSTTGSASGLDDLAEILAEGWAAGGAAAHGLGKPLPKGGPPQAAEAFPGSSNSVAALAPPPGTDLKHTFVDFQNDVTLADVDLAWQEGYRSVEHLKRYTTLGMATDQGKTSNIIGLARLASHEGRPVPEVGLTTFRPPYTPVTLGALAGHATGFHSAPLRRPALYDLHAARDPIWQPVGYWMRPRAYPLAGENLHAASIREARAVRETVGWIDVSTLGKFEIAGPDAAALLERVCATTVGKLAVGRGRYTFMLREDGLVMDDGTVWRIGPDRYLLTSSTGGADRMAHHLAYVRQVLAPQLKVAIANVQEHWAGIAVAGPRAKALVAELTGLAEIPRHMSVARGVIAGTPVLILAASYSGERAFEIYAASQEIAPVWTAIDAAGQALGGHPYGIEALEFLRIEKGHVVVGGEIDGRTTPQDLGLHRMLNPARPFVGAPALQRPAFQSQAGRLQLIGLESEGSIPEGSMLVRHAPGEPEGHVTAASPRVLAQGSVALALLRDGADRMGETLIAWSPTRGVSAKVRVVEPVFYDPEGARYRD
ncbi:2Fe-2S iron-sulfur cluster-binding protein [Phenylobacterium aquaticum]|uniref:2Fe-2S iron-sulfur cluster-binding protein n=1 Tax=Phenylobacterium aquaticum TaxID=1763816 RepID=UPI0026EFFDCA|nr:2Fe-2S iron-sulfur cluster-binding protein [Phenylobacterium aquaticum]